MTGDRLVASGEARRKETDEDAKGRESARTNLTAYFVDDTQDSNAGDKKLGTGELAAIMGHASDILSKNGINSITFKMENKSKFFDKNGNKKRLGFWDLFIAVTSFSDVNNGRSVGFSDVAPLTGITDTWGISSSSEIYPRTYVNYNHGYIAGHSDPLYAAGYVAAHELLHQMISKAIFLQTGKGPREIHTNGWDNLNRIKVVIPEGPLKNSKGKVGLRYLQQAEMITGSQLVLIKKHLLNKRP